MQNSFECGTRFGNRADARGEREFRRKLKAAQKRAFDAESAEDYVTAVEAFREYLAYVPDDGGAWHNLGVHLMTVGRDDGAIEAFAKALPSLKLDPPSFDDELTGTREYREPIKSLRANVCFLVGRIDGKRGTVGGRSLLESANGALSQQLLLHWQMGYDEAKEDVETEKRREERAYGGVNQASRPPIGDSAPVRTPSPIHVEEEFKAPSPEPAKRGNKTKSLRVCVAKQGELTSEVGVLLHRLWSGYFAFVLVRLTNEATEETTILSDLRTVERITAGGGRILHFDVPSITPDVMAKFKGCVSMLFKKSSVRFAGSGSPENRDYQECFRALEECGGNLEKLAVRLIEMSESPECERIFA